jgi:hypothetical protein
VADIATRDWSGNLLTQRTDSHLGTECKNIAKVLAVPRKKRVPRALFL